MNTNSKMKINDTDVLLVIDMQNDFCPADPTDPDSHDGSLMVTGGRDIEQGITELAKAFPTVVMSQDWHPKGHTSFASSHPGKPPFSTMEMPYGTQVLWPDHCVQGTRGADFARNMYRGGVVGRAAKIFQKGSNPEVDSYSAFLENDHQTSTGLGDWLKARGAKRVFVVGLAYDFCVGYSALDAVEQIGLEAVIIKDLCRAIKQPLDGPFADTEVMMEDKFRRAGVKIINRDHLVDTAVAVSTDTSSPINRDDLDVVDAPNQQTATTATKNNPKV